MVDMTCRSVKSVSENGAGVIFLLLCACMCACACVQGGGCVPSY